MIRFVKTRIFSGDQRLFFVRGATNSVVKVHTIRFVGLPLISASRGLADWRMKANGRQSSNAKAQITNQVQMPKSE
jgi:hypothetical protein